MPCDNAIREICGTHRGKAANDKFWLQGQPVRFARLSCGSWLCNGGKGWGSPGKGRRFSQGTTVVGTGVVLTKDVYT